MKKAIICDIDGTLSNPEKRRKFLEGDKKNWKGFYSGMDLDEINLWCKEIIERFKKDHEIMMVTGRSSGYETITRDWLLANEVPYDHLFMREKGDHREDYLVKAIIYENYIQDYFDVLFVIEDRTQVVEMWREKGLVVLQCDKGNF